MDQFETRGIHVVNDVEKEGALAVYRSCRAAVDAGRINVNNARQG